MNNMGSFFKQKKQMNTFGIIHSSESFRLILERERARAERTGHVFSLVVFDSNNGKGNEAIILGQLGSVLLQKVRMSDEVGWFDEEKSIGALLPGTSAEGAWQFIDIVRDRMGDAAAGLLNTVYTHPYSWNDLLESQHDDSGESANSGGVDRDNGKSVKSTDLLFAHRPPLWKSAVDFVGAILLISLLSPLFLFITLLIKIVSPGPVFYRQQRIGFQGKPFWIWKFRTMHVDNDGEEHRRYLNHLLENDVPMTKMDDGGDRRIIPFGKFLRYSCLDELPQLFNVLNREMSLVGPRPCLPYEAAKYLRWHTRRFDTLPGMTGLWQVTGKNRTTFKEMIRLDIRYSRKMSPALDTKILLLTAPAILGMVSEPLVRKTAMDRDAAAASPSRREQVVRG